MKVEMGIRLMKDGADLRGVYIVDVPDRRLHQAFRFKLHDFRSDSPRFEVTHNHLAFISLQFSDDDALMLEQEKRLPLGRRALLEMMKALFNSASPVIGSKAAKRARKAKFLPVAVSSLTSTYESQQTSDALYSELFALPEPVASDDEPSPTNLH